NWGTVSVYAWTSGGGETAKFPGVAMTRDGDAEYGGVNYSAQIPEDSAGIIFSAGENAAKTVDITDLSAEGWYTTDNQSEGNYIAYKWGETPPEDPTPAGPSFKFTDNRGWGTVYMHAWNDGGALTQWPGDVMSEKTTNDMGETVFTIHVPNGATGVVLSNGNGDQTVNITDFSQEGYYTKGYRDGEGHLYVTSWSEPSGPSAKKILFTCGWGSCFLYSWNDSDGKPSGEWPGTQVTETTTNDMGEKQFVVYVPADAAHIIFNNGSGTQTVNIDNLDVTGYYITGGPDNALTVASW
ncbi:MAG: starch-binding protein, partial [Ruminococcus sp.]